MPDFLSPRDFDTRLVIGYVHLLQRFLVDDGLASERKGAVPGVGKPRLEVDAVIAPTLENERPLGSPDDRSHQI